MRAVRLILAIALALFGAFKLYHAFRSHGNFDAYSLGVVNVVLGFVLFWQLFFRPQR